MASYFDNRFSRENTPNSDLMYFADDKIMREKQASHKPNGKIKADISINLNLLQIRKAI